MNFFCLHYFSLWAKWNEISFWDWSVKRAIKNEKKKTERDIETSMLEATRQAFIKQYLR